MIVLTAVLMVVAAAVALGLNSVFSPHCVPVDSLADIRPGMTKDEVTRLIGPPQRVVDYRDEHRLSYWKPFVYCTVEVFLDGEGRVQGYQDASIFHDH